MAVTSTAYQFSAAYGTTVAWKKGTPSEKNPPVQPEDAETSVPTQLEIKTPSREEFLHMCGAVVSETANEDGTVTKTVSGGFNFTGAGNFGSTCTGRMDFRAALTFDPTTYRDGQLGATADFMAAAYTVAQRAMTDFVNNTLNAGPNVLEAYEGYPDQKDEVAKSFAGMVGTPLEEQGRAGEWDKVYKSVHAVFASFEAKYEAVTASVDKGRWMDADLWTAAVKLQRLSASFQVESGRAVGLYSLRELEYAAIGLRGGLNLKA